MSSRLFFSTACFEPDSGPPLWRFSLCRATNPFMTEMYELERFFIRSFSCSHVLTCVLRDEGTYLWILDWSGIFIL